MERCATCRWWEKESEREWGICELTSTYNHERNPYGDRETESAARASCAVAIFPYGVNETPYIALGTRADFGCVQWQAAPAPTPPATGEGM
jgi:hypothetical protein